MSPVHPEELEQRVTALTRDVGPLCTAAGLGVDVSDAVVDAALTTLGARAGWTVLDGRSGECAVADVTRAAEGPAETVLIVVRKERLPRLVGAWVNALVEGRAEIAVEGETRILRPLSQSVVVVCLGATALEQVGRELSRMGYWDFVNR